MARLNYISQKGNLSHGNNRLYRIWSVDCRLSLGNAQEGRAVKNKYIFADEIRARERERAWFWFIAVVVLMWLLLSNYESIGLMVWTYLTGAK